VSLLAMLPGGNPLLWGAGVALVAALAFGGVQSLRLAETRAALADEQADRAATLAKWRQAALEQTERMRATEAQWRESQNENARLASKAREQAALDAAAAGAAADRLRDRFAAVTATCHSPASHPAAVAAGPAASAPADLLADVLGRMDEATRRIAAYADAAGIAGEQCAADYAALTPQP
jgi:hypothetical protein